MLLGYFKVLFNQPLLPDSRHVRLGRRKTVLLFRRNLSCSTSDFAYSYTKTQLDLAFQRKWHFRWRLHSD